jgi:hypothetical protein
MLGLISLRFFDWSGHIDAFRSIVGEAQGGEFFPPSPDEAEHQLRAHPTRDLTPIKQHGAYQIGEILAEITYQLSGVSGR